MLNFDRNLMNLFGSCEKLPKDPGGNILVKYLEDRGGEVGEKKLNKGIKVEIDTKTEETRLTNPERQMKHENRLSLFFTDSHMGKS